MFQKLRQRWRPRASSSPTARPADLLEVVKAGLKSIRRPRPRRHRVHSRPVVDGNELAWQERANIAAALEHEEDEMVAAQRSARMTVRDESRVCWWLDPDRPTTSARTSVRASSPYDASPFVDGGDDIHCRRSVDTW